MLKSKLISTLVTKSPRTSRNLAVLAATAGLFQALVVVVINTASETIETGLDFRLFLMCFVCIAAFVATKRMTLTGSARYAYDIVYEIRFKLVDKIRTSSLKGFEDLGQARLLTNLNQNSEIIIEAIKAVSHASSAAVMLFFSFIYIYFLSLTAFIMTGLLLLAGSYHYLRTSKKIGPQLREAREIDSRFHGFLLQLINGFKEIKINQAKSDDLYHNTIRPNSLEAKEATTKAEILYINNNLFVQIFFLVLIASVVFILPQFAAFSTVILRDLIAVLLFCIGSIVSVVQVIPMLAKADAALHSLAKLEEELDQANDMQETNLAEPDVFGGRIEEITLEKITFSYNSQADAKGFTLGPLDLTLRAGETVFITGGNGGGKSTLLKIIAGLYYPHSGVMSCNGTWVDSSNYLHYRNFYSVIFTDFHLFDRLYGLESIDQSRVDELLRQMELDQATSFDKGRFSSLNLSTGQKKRLAIIAACLEDKQVLLFDEVAADQDPVFRKFFYTQLLGQLKKQGKTIIAATHDDRYFQVADRCLRMEFGKLLNEE